MFRAVALIVTAFFIIIKLIIKPILNIYYQVVNFCAMIWLFLKSFNFLFLLSL